MTTPLRAAVVGLGSMGANHARVLGDLEGIELCAVVDADSSRVAKAAHRPGIGGYEATTAMLKAQKPDIVSVVVPTQLHEEVALACIRAGAHVLVEKPIAGTFEAGMRIAEAARGAGVMVTVGHIERFNPPIVELKRRLAAGEGGRVLQVKARRVGPYPHRIRDVGVIHDLGPHDIDVMRYLLRDDIVRVYAEVDSHIKTDHEDLFSGLVRFRGGAIGTFDINWLTPTKERTITVLCERGMFVADYAAQTLSFFENEAAQAREDRIASVTEGSMTRYAIQNREPLRAELEAFRDAVRSGGEAPVPAADALAAMVVVEALVESGRRGQPVTLEARK